ncbi:MULTISPECIES: hypothetical protein [Bradyrhizobium]|uniref:hypothetical protein n=1 Tax=Bradyrhizobium TaxID=374 RepID=UPI00155F0F6E|nr:MULTISPECIES: hypothetical protein [Bradyrhizobium]MDD1521615.1 hypothetical protein [Bradyrhizobium sp. WBAH30]MDD1546022.1 hypothetical protein [Bradyrhizobium sp. WBAH41]MDD1559224.1 hypothetical protein [Bradyrhizobium sp. WBAH23]MDD1566740.1 hypothetical protein [Bradyrhizobium sp. WBAH33]MDD1592614.1 hypothetical protein [Bradyrhizobium sp. WBAH42]
MDIASNGLSPAHASKLRLVKDMRERSALRELSNMEAKRHLAVQAVQEACEHLAHAEERRAKLEAELYREMLAADAISVCELQRRYHLIIGRLTDEIKAAQRALDEARAAQEQAEAAVLEARSVWTKRSAASQKWREIDHDVRRITDAHFEAAAEIEADDEVLLRYRRGRSGQTGGERT